MEDIIESSPSEETVEEGTQEETQDTQETTTQDPLKNELEKVQQRQGRSKEEKLLYTKKRIEQQLKELGVEEDDIEQDDDAPVTIGMLKKLQAEQATKTAVQLADEIADQSERALTKFHIENTIRSTGNPKEDFALALALTNAAKNRQILEEQARKGGTKTHASSNGGPAKFTPPEAELTPDELRFTQPPFNLTKEEILKSRQ